MYLNMSTNETLLQGCEIFVSVFNKLKLLKIYVIN